MKNKYKILQDNLGQYVEIEMIRRDKRIFYTTVDLSDLQKILDFGYSLHAEYSSSKNRFYAEFSQYLGLNEDGKSQYRTILLQRFLTDTVDDNVYIDHEDHNTMNNRQYNFRICTNSDNTKHRKGLNNNNKSGYRNVCWIDGYWKVQIQIDGKNHRFAENFTDVHEAGKFAKLKREEIYKEFSGN